MEIEQALFMMHPHKSPGPDGFFVKHWSFLKERVCDAVKEFLNGGEMPEAVNNTVLVLIPKIKSPQELAQYRPIALCNVLYKMGLPMSQLTENFLSLNHLKKCNRSSKKSATSCIFLAEKCNCTFLPEKCNSCTFLWVTET